MKLIPFILLFALFSACQDSSQTIAKMEEIKRVGNDDPALAMEMLDSVRLYIQNSSEYVQMKFRLLEIRLSDKAYIKPTSDSAIINLIPYFEANGTLQDKQEMYYYAGSVYRDLHDTPRALEYFLHSLSLCDNGACDSLMLRNTYSNLHWLYYNVQDYENALIMADNELQLARRMNIIDEKTYIHKASTLKRLNRPDEAIPLFNKVLELISRQNAKDKIQTYIILLKNYSYLEEFDKAELCYKLIFDNNQMDTILDNSEYALALGCFFLETNRVDSAEHLYQTIIANGNIEQVYDAARHLCLIKSQQHDLVAANKYASIFITASDSLNLGERQKLAATVNNEFQYYSNQEAEKRLKAESERRRRLLLIISFSSALIIVSLTAIYNYIRKRQLKIILAKTEELTNLKQDTARKEAELDEARQQLDNVNRQLERASEDLKIKEARILEKTQQAKLLSRLLSQSEMEDSADDVIEAIRKSAVGHYHMTSHDWKRLFNAVDTIYPTFKSSILDKLGNLSESQFQVCYLLCIGLTNPEIQNLTDLASTTVWRWAKRYNAALNLPLLR